MIQGRELTIIEAWDALNKINNDIDLLETLIKTRLDISASKLKEILVSCTFTNNDRFINSIASKDEDIVRLSLKYQSKNAYENYIRNEINRLKLSDMSLCIAFLKEYKKLTWEEIAKEMTYSIKQCKRYYDEYKGKAPNDNSWFNEPVIELYNQKESVKAK